MKSDFDRWIDLKDFGLPEVPLIARRASAKAHEGLKFHKHEGKMEICYLDSGQQTYHVSGRDYHMMGNDLFVTFPDEVHGSGANIHGKGILYWMNIYLPSSPSGFLSLERKEAEKLIASLKGLKNRFFRGDRKIKELFTRVFNCCESKNDPLARLKISIAIIECLNIVTELANKKDSGRITDDIRNVLSLIEKNRSSAVSIEEMAGKAKLSPSRFKAKFKQQTGISPGEYMQRFKIEKAKEMLFNTRRTITDIAFGLGFTSSQYFATAFRKFTTQTPRGFRMKKQSAH